MKGSWLEAVCESATWELASKVREVYPELLESGAFSRTKIF